MREAASAPNSAALALVAALQRRTRVEGVSDVAGARALLRGGDFVLPDDIKGCALAVLRHRVRLAPELDIEGISVDQLLQQLLDQVPAPRL